MPAIGFICPDQQKITFKECLSECRITFLLPCGRCKALPLLRKAAAQREWTGHPSTTQLLQGTREAWLKITRPYYIDPEDRIYAILGQNAHAALEKFVPGDCRAEERIKDEICSGAFDFYDPSPEILYDYKTWGVFKVAQALGIKRMKVPERDLQGNVVLLKSGKNKGQPKMTTVAVCNDVATRVNAILDTSVQLSNYRDKLRTILKGDKTIQQMAVQVICKDSASVLKRMGVTEKAPLIPINGVSKHWVDKYLRKKRELLMDALDKDHAPICRAKERWSGNKCIKSCEVRAECIKLPGWENLPLPVDLDDNTEMDEAA